MPESLKQKEPEEYKGYNILCIGEGGGDTSSMSDRPVPVRFGAVAEKIRKGASYFSLERLEDGKYFVRSTFEERQEKHLERAKLEKNKDRHFIIGDAEQLPLKENSIDEIWIENVFSDPDRFLDAKDGIKEAARVLRKGGHLYAFNDNTPGVAHFLKDIDVREYGLTKHVLAGTSLRSFLIRQNVKPDDLDHLMNSRKRYNKPLVIVYRKK